MPYPRMARIKQKFDSMPGITDIGAKVHEELKKPNIMSKIKAGQTVAITAGSRGIANMDRIIGAIVKELKDHGAKPFVIPAMGSHGNANAEGQREILLHYNITEQTMGCPILSSMETVQLGQTADSITVYLDKNAFSADHIVVVNRVKQHTDFSGKIESGLIKMMAIGLGKRDGASMYHKASLKFGFEKVLRGVANVVLNTGKVAFGVGVVENPYDQTAIISATSAEELIKTEEYLQEQAKRLAAKLPFDDIDVLIVDEIGKDISGLGLDTKVIGRMMQTGEKDPEFPRITRILVLDLTPNSMGNAAGIGLADFTTKRLVDKIKYEPTYMNFITSAGPQKVRIPINFDNDRKVLDAVFDTIGMVKPEDSKVVRIKNTLRLDEVDISESLIEPAKVRDDLEIIDTANEMIFDEKDNLKPIILQDGHT
ncbi:MAG: lactate racemase domain-containing protein [Candidatus Poribacteria bacterium]